MSLLEGHADYVMDGVGPQVVPSVLEIREKFQQRRARGASRLDQALRKLLGLDAKLRQYRDGERFVRAVVEDVGMDGFNRVWTSPNTLPTKAEIARPRTGSPACTAGRTDHPRGADNEQNVEGRIPIQDRRNTANHPSEGPWAKDRRAILGKRPCSVTIDALCVTK